MPEGYIPSLITSNLPSCDEEEPDVPFVPCGDPYGLDSERTYQLSDDEWKEICKLFVSIIILYCWARNQIYF